MNPYSPAVTVTMQNNKVHRIHCKFYEAVLTVLCICCKNPKDK